MKKLLQRVLNIRPEEWPRFLLLYVTLFLLIMGNVWGRTTIYGGFLEVATVEALPTLLIVTSILSVIVASVYSVFADRVSNARLMIAILVIVAVGLAIGIILLFAGRQQPFVERAAYVYLYGFFLIAIQGLTVLHWGTYRNAFYDAQSAKRLVPALASATRLGAVVGGATLPLLNDNLTRFLQAVGLSAIDAATGVVIAITLLWLLTRLATAGLVWLSPRLLSDSAASGKGTSWGRKRPSFVDSLREGQVFITGSAYLRWMAVSAFILMIFLALVEYRGGQLLAEGFADKQALSNFLAVLTAWGNAFLLPIQLVFLSRIIRKTGLANTALIFPFGGLVTAAILALVGGLSSLAAAAGGVAHLGRTVFRTAFYNPVDNLLYNAVPLNVRGRARAFVKGIIVPVGTLIGGALLNFSFVTQTVAMPVLLAVLAVAFLGSMLMIRRLYGPALIEMLEQEDFASVLSSEASELTVTDPAALKLLEQKLADSTNPRITIFIAQLISRAGGPEGAPILRQAARDTADPQVRTAIINLLIAAEQQDDATGQLYQDLLADPDERVREAAVTGLAGLVGSQNVRFLEAAHTLLTDPSLSVQAQVIPTLIHSGDFFYMADAVRTLDQMLTSDDPLRRARGVRVLGQVGDRRFARSLWPFLADPADPVRLEVTLAIETLTRAGGSETLAHQSLIALTELLQDPVEPVRLAAIRLLGYLQIVAIYPPLLEVLIDPSVKVREAAVETLVEIGEPVVALIAAGLEAGNPQQRKMSAIVLSRINAEIYGDLIDTFVDQNLAAIYRNHGRLLALAPTEGRSGITLLLSTLREQNQALLAEIFYLLRSVHDVDALEVIENSLQNEAERIRANATEALEALTSPQTALLVSVLYDPAQTSAQLQALGHETWQLAPLTPRQVIHQLISDSDPWLRTIVAFALGEIGALLPAGSSPSSPKPQTGERSRGRDVPRNLANLFAGADDSSAAAPPADQPAVQPDPPTQPTERAERQRRRRRAMNVLSNLADELTGNDQSAGATAQEPDAAVEPERGLSERYQTLFERADIVSLLDTAMTDPVRAVRVAAQAARRTMDNVPLSQATLEDVNVLSKIEKIIFLKEVPFFRDMTIDQLQVLADICEEENFPAESYIFEEGDLGGILYVVVNGRVAIERQGRRKGATARLATFGPHDYFGEMTLFNNLPRTASALTTQETLVIKVRREPLVALARQYPDLSLELINVLSQRLNEANEQIAGLTRSHPRELQKLYDQFED